MENFPNPSITDKFASEAKTLIGTLLATGLPNNAIALDSLDNGATFSD
jgi:hypothetical protein